MVEAMTSGQTPVVFPGPAKAGKDLEIFDEFKETEIGPIPVDWEVVRLGDLALLVNSGATPRGGKKTYQTIGIPFIRSQNVLMNRLSLDDIAYISEETHQDMKRSQVQPGDVLLNITGASIGRVACVPDSLPVANVNQHVCRIRLDTDNVHSPYVAYYLTTGRAQAEIMGTQYGTTRQGLNYGQVKMLRIKLPPLPEQRRIAHVLSTIQREIAAQDNLIATARKVKRSLMERLFTYGPCAEPAPTKETEIGEVPEHWEVARLGEALKISGGSVQTGPFGSLLHASDYVVSGFPVVMPKDLTNQGKILLEKIACIGIEDYQRLERYHLREGDLLVARRGEIGRRGLVTERESGWVCGTGCLRIRPGHSLDSIFLMQAFETTRLREWLAAHAIGTTMLNLSAQILNQLPVPLPPFPEQPEIARILSTMDRKIAIEENRKAALQALFKSMLHQLMTGQIRLRDVE